MSPCRQERRAPVAGIQDCPHLTDIVYSSSISSSRVLFWLQPGNTNLTLMHMRVRIVRITLRTQAKQHQIKKAIRKSLQSQVKILYAQINDISCICLTIYGNKLCIFYCLVDNIKSIQHQNSLHISMNNMTAQADCLQEVCFLLVILNDISPVFTYVSKSSFLAREVIVANAELPVCVQLIPSFF